MNAAFCCASLGILPTVRHTDYTGSGLEALREDNAPSFARHPASAIISLSLRR